MLTFAESMNNFQLNINAIVSGLYDKGLKHVVISPGSRNAPLIMAFVRFKKIKCYSVVDERSAGFIALGMAKQLQEPVAVLCTSGSALLNFYPAVVEAFYMQVPLIVISADRPSEFIDRWDGQTIVQNNVLEPHVLQSFAVDEELDELKTNEIFELINELYDVCNALLKGPVHLNVPLREPLYAAKDNVFEYPTPLKIKAKEEEINEWEIGFDGEEFFKAFPKVMILLGADENFEDAPQLIELSKRHFAVVCADVISNEHFMNSFSNWELIFMKANSEQQVQMVPDLLITSGKMILNKKLKKLFRNHQPKQHWHIAESGYFADPFFTNPQILTIKRQEFFEQFLKFVPNVISEYYNTFFQLSKTINLDFINHSFSEIGAINQVLQQLPNQINLHLSNSMTIRNCAFLMHHFKKDWSVFSNRGVSGIDGCTSTALGFALVSDRLNVLITGDLAFFYDINAFWNQLVPNHFKVIMMNNSGGGIFERIDGTEGLEELNPFIKTPHFQTAELVAKHFGLSYFKANNYESLSVEIKRFLQEPKASILEIQTEEQINIETFKQLKSL